MVPTVTQKYGGGSEGGDDGGEQVHLGHHLGRLNFEGTPWWDLNVQSRHFDTPHLYSLHNIINAMNAAILNADLPISIRMKRANRRGWMLDRRDNIKFLVHGVQAYRQLAAPLAWEGTFEQTRNQPAPFATFGQQSLDLEYEAFALNTTLDDLQSKHYPGVGNDVQKLHNAIDNLENLAVVRHEEDKMMALTKTALLKAVQAAKNRQMTGFERLPLRDQMRSATYAKEDVVRQLAETLNLDAADVAQLVQNAPALTPRPPSRQRTPLRSPRSPASPPTSVTEASPLSPVAEGAAGPSTGLVDDAYGSML